MSCDEIAITRLRELDDAPALTADGRTLTYGEVGGAAGALAARLDGVSRAAVWAEPSLAACVAALAIVESGIELVPLNPKLGSSELDHILADAGPEVVVGGPVDGTLATLPRVEVDLDARAEMPVPAASREEIALIIYTSGTTGRPKGAMLPRRALVANLDGLAEAWAWTADDRLVHALPIFHVHGLVLGLFGPLRRGGSVHHLGRFSPAATIAALEAGDTMLFAVPTMYHRLAEFVERDATAAAALSRARLLVSGSAPLSASTFRRIEVATGQQIVERYGMTETLINTAVRADGERRAGEVGPPVPGVEVRVLDDEGAEVPSDGETIGEISVRGDNLFLGYLNRPQATAEAMRDGWFWTGDLATRAADGYLRIVGRRSTDLIKTGGFKVGAGEIEEALLEHPAVAEAAVTAEPDEDLGERIVAWIVLAPAAESPSEREMADHVANLLAPHKRPRSVRVLPELPRNAMGKVIKTRLAD